MQISRHLAETRQSENVVQVIQDRVNSRQLVEHGDGNRKEQRKPIARGEQMLLSVLSLELYGSEDGSQLSVDILLPDACQHLARFFFTAFLGQPTRATWNLEQHQEEQHGGNH